MRKSTKRFKATKKKTISNTTKKERGVYFIKSNTKGED
jgi:hypothetical protein